MQFCLHFQTEGKTSVCIQQIWDCYFTFYSAISLLILVTEDVVPPYGNRCSFSIKWPSTFSPLTQDLTLHVTPPRGKPTAIRYIPVLTIYTAIVTSQTDNPTFLGNTQRVHGHHSFFVCEWLQDTAWLLKGIPTWEFPQFNRILQGVKPTTVGKESFPFTAYYGPWTCDNNEDYIVVPPNYRKQ